MGIARRKAGKISKAVTKSISKGGSIMCANSIFHQKSYKDSTKNDKMSEKTVGCVEKFFLRIRHVQTRAV